MVRLQVRASKHELDASEIELKVRIKFKGAEGNTKVAALRFVESALASQAEAIFAESEEEAAEQLRLTTIEDIDWEVLHTKL
jgi:3-hydroxymyristoyl/3-hydroxydecanoyl-(acyl carrier protein) dehydratase